VTLLPAGAMAAEAPRSQVVDRIVAVVNDQIILLSELAQQSLALEERAAREVPDPIGKALARKQVRSRVLDDMVAEKLIAAEAKALGIGVGDREIDTDIARIKKENNLTDAQLAQQMAQQGIDEKGLREYLRKQATRRKVLEVRVTPRVVIADAEVRAYYEENFKNDDEVHCRMISKRVPRDASDSQIKSVREKLEKIRVAVTSGGKDFATVAKAESEGSNPGGGGDVGWFRRGEVAPEVEQSAFALKSGEVSAVVELNGAFHLVQVVERRSNPPKPFEQVQDKIRMVLFNRAGEREYDRWIAEVRAKSFVEVRLDGPVSADAGK
jgi:peptidyl-prolyl cis-trans isomerase SurA